MSLYPSVHDSYCISFTFYKLLVFFVFFYKYKSGLNCSAIEALLLRSTQVNQSRVILTRSKTSPNYKYATKMPLKKLTKAA